MNTSQNKLFRKNILFFMFQCLFYHKFLALSFVALAFDVTGFFLFWQSALSYYETFIVSIPTVFWQDWYTDLPKLFWLYFLEHLHVMSLFYPHSLGFWKTKIEPVFAVRPVFLSRLDCIVTKCSCSHDIVIIMIIGWFHLACLLSYLLWKYRGFALIMVFLIQKL